MNLIARNPMRCTVEGCEEKLEIAKLKAQVALLREALLSWATLIEFQYTGSKEAMTHLQICDNIGQEALEATK